MKQVILNIEFITSNGTKFSELSLAENGGQVMVKPSGLMSLNEDPMSDLLEPLGVQGETRNLVGIGIIIMKE